MAYGKDVAGPAVAPDATWQEAMFTEASATFLLMAAVCAFGMTRVGKVYAIKMPLIALAIRAIIHTHGATGPAINPMLGTAWAFYAAGSAWPTRLACASTRSTGRWSTCGGAHAATSSPSTWT